MLPHRGGLSSVAVTVPLLYPGHSPRGFKRHLILNKHRNNFIIHNSVKTLHVPLFCLVEDLRPLKVFSGRSEAERWNRGGRPPRAPAAQVSAGFIENDFVSFDRYVN